MFISPGLCDNTIISGTLTYNGETENIPDVDRQPLWNGCFNCGDGSYNIVQLQCNTMPNLYLGSSGVCQTNYTSIKTDYYNTAASSTCNPLSFIFVPPSGNNQTFTVTNSQPLPVCPICVTVEGCNMAGSGTSAIIGPPTKVNNALVTFTNTSGVVFSGTTNINGQTVIDIQQPGSYVYGTSVSGNALFGPTGTIQLTCGESVELFMCKGTQIVLVLCGQGNGLTLNIDGLGSFSNLQTPYGPLLLLQGQDTWGLRPYTVTGSSRYAPASGNLAIGCCNIDFIVVDTASGYICSPCFTDPIPNILYGSADGVEFSIPVEVNDFSNSACVSKSAPTVLYADICEPPIDQTDPCTYNEEDIGAAIALQLLSCNIKENSISSSDCSCELDLGGGCNYAYWHNYCPVEEYFNCDLDQTYYTTLFGGGCFCLNSRFLDSTVNFTDPVTSPLPVPVNITVSMPGQLFGSVTITE